MKSNYFGQRDNRAEIALKKGDLGKAIRLYLKAIDRAPGLSDYRVRLAMLYQSAGVSPKATIELQRALEIQPHNSDYQLLYIELFMMNGHMDMADKWLENIYRSPRRDPNVTFALAKLANSRHLIDQAIGLYQDYLLAQPDSLPAYRELGSLLMRNRRYGDAIAMLKTGLMNCPVSVELKFMLGAAYHFEGDFDSAMRSYTEALELDHEHVQAAVGLAQLCKLSGDNERAYDILYPIYQRHSYSPLVLTTFNDLNPPQHKRQEVLDAMKSLLNTGNLSDYDRSALCFSLGRAYDKDKKYDMAFDYYRRANEELRINFDKTSIVSFIEEIERGFSSEICQHVSRSGNRTQVPVFIVGMPRSGTSLIEQILSAHPEVYGAGELNDIQSCAARLTQSENEDYPACLRHLEPDKVAALSNLYLNKLHSMNKGASRVIDKMPTNFLHLGLISIMFPEARIIHSVRDPRDTCLSCYFHMFSGSHPYAYSLENLGQFYRLYERLMQYWKAILPNPILDVQYEQLIDDHETVIRRLVSYCGLDWHDGCLHFHNNERAVMTASSEQVRQPLYRSSVGRWRAYSKYLAPLNAALNDYG